MPQLSVATRVLSRTKFICTFVLLAALPAIAAPSWFGDNLGGPVGGAFNGKLGGSLPTSKHEPNWQTGKVLETPFRHSPNALTLRGPYHDEGDGHIVTIRAGETTYTLYEKRAWKTWCLLVPGTTVNFALVGDLMELKDSTGARCKMTVVPPNTASR